jgi:hypothetical protein
VELREKPEDGEEGKSGSATVFCEFPENDQKRATHRLFVFQHRKNDTHLFVLGGHFAMMLVDSSSVCCG